MQNIIYDKLIDNTCSMKVDTLDFKNTNGYLDKLMYAHCYLF